ncbi:MAG: sulfatase-like hydrolase/transferase [Proteobacteria bacterium]|nr:sulfatase-like hydrolase/transferase [Pseudomonadota bacterium]
MIHSVLTWAVSGLVIGLTLGLADALVLTLKARAMFFDSQELARTASWTVGLCAGAGTLGLAGIGLGVDLIRAGISSSTKNDPHLRLSIAATAIFAIPFYLILWQLTKGPQASQIPARPFIVAGGTLLLSVTGGMAAVLIPRWAAAASNRRRFACLSAATLSICLYAIDLTVLVRLYPVFHSALTAGAFIVGGVGLRIWFRTPGCWFPASILTLASIGFVVWGGWSIAAIRSTQNPRFVVGERTAAASDLLSLARVIMPPAPEKNLDTDFPEIDIATSAQLPKGQALIRPDADVILLTVDAMRYDRLATLGANRRPAPNLDALAEKSVVFTRAYTPIPHTSHAINSLLTGKYTHSLFQIPGAPRVHETWPEILSRFRYKTAAFFTRAIFFIDRAQFEPYIRSSYGFSFRKVDYQVPANERAEQLIAYLKEMQGDDHPVFAWAHFFDPHEPYNPECSRFGDRPQDRYDCEIWTVDQAIGRILTYLNEAYPESIIIVTSDHGEEFDDHGGRFHGTTLYDEQVRVPLIIHVPGEPHRLVDEPVSLVDLLGTTLTLLDIPIPARVRSRNLTGLLAGRKEQYDTFSEVHDKAMIATQGHKLICDSAADICRLYDLTADPLEKRSIAREKPAVTAHMKKRLRAWQRSHARFELRPVETDQGATQWPEAVQRALTGDRNALPGLMAVIREETRLKVLRKAARLLYNLWDDRPLEELIATTSEISKTDPEVTAWLLVLRSEAGEVEATQELAKVKEKLEPLSDVWRAVALAHFRYAGRKSVIQDVVDVATCEQAPVEQRLMAIDLLGKSARRTIVPSLLGLIDNYQLTLEIAAALGRIGDRRAVKPLITRLKRERFSERKAAIISSLSAIGDRRAAKAIAHELFLNEPPAGVLNALVRLGWALPQGRLVALPAKGVKAIIYAEPLKLLFSPRMNYIKTIILSTSAQADGGSVVISCSGKESGRIQLLSGNQEIFSELRSCRDQDGNFPLVRLKIEPNDIDAKISALALIGR